MRVYLPALTLVALLPCSLFGQGFILPPVESATMGTVVGHVMCGDTRLPARLAGVKLLRVPTPTNADKAHGADQARSGRIDLGSGTAQTQLDGSFTIAGMPPGDYYVTAQLPGYLSSASEFTPNDLSHPTEETVHRMAQLLTPVTVTANSISRVDISLMKGGTISGTVRYEDGMPLFNSQVELLRHDPKGNTNDYYPVETAAGTVRTDDQGGYRFAGLPGGEYKLYAKLQVNEPPPDPAWFQGRVVSVNDLVAASNQWSQITVYLDHGFRQADSRSVKLLGGEVSSGNDVEIRLSKLHSISGKVVDAETGSAVNSANIKILWSADDPDSKATQIDNMNVGEDGSFHFGLVPEGTYKLTVTGAKAVVHQQALVPPPPKAANGTMQPVQPTDPVDKTSREYIDASQPLTVISDMSDVKVQLKGKPAVAVPQ